ncbi:hypothetical protein [Agromyces sp. NPDC056965]|uniref:hypothetical protein n=1 Tax=Agromyces sp. NPDC056965 TaxID=3345983 RepID=UPI00363BEC3E
MRNRHAIGAGIAVTVVAALSCSGAAAPALALDLDGPGTTAVPVEIVESPGIGPTPTITITVGGAELTLNLDTGSNGLVLRPGVVVPDAVPTGVTHHQNYVSGGVTGEVELATIEFGDLAIPNVPFLLGDELTCPDWEPQPCTPPTRWPLHPSATQSDGMLGIGQAGEAAILESPLGFAPGSAGEGFTLDFTDPSNSRLVIGPVRVPDGSTWVHQEPGTGTYANGMPRYQKPVGITWTIGDIRSHHTTVFDTGEPIAHVFAEVYGALPQQEHLLDPGQSVAQAGADVAAPFNAFTTTAMDEPGGVVKLDTTTDNGGHYNTGLGFFLHRAVHFDSANGRIVFLADAPPPATPAPAPAAAGAEPALAESGPPLDPRAGASLAVLALGLGAVVTASHRVRRRPRSDG